jgi:hypothetical protein
MEIPEFLTRCAMGVASTCIVALGAGVINGARTNAVQDQQIAVIQHHEKSLDDTLTQLSSDVQQLNVNVAVLNERMKNGKR